MSWLLDTCVLSEYAKKAPAPHVIAWLDQQDEESLFMSVISLGEIEKGIVKLAATDPGRSQKHIAWLARVLSSALADATCRLMPPRSMPGLSSPPARNSPDNPCR